MSTDSPTQTATPSADSPSQPGRPYSRVLFLARLTWGVLAALTLILHVAFAPLSYEVGLSLYSADVLQPFGLSATFVAVHFLVLRLAILLGFVAVGAVIFWYRSREWPAFWTSLALILAPNSLAPAFLLIDEQSPWSRLVLLLSHLSIGLDTIVFYFFPDGRFVPNWTRWLALGAGVWALARFILYPLGDNPLVPVPLFSITGLVGGFFWWGTGVYAQIYRYRRVSTPEQRQQTKWFVFGLTAAFLGFFGYALPFVIIPALSEVGGLPICSGICLVTR